MKIHAVLIDTVSIQKYIFNSNRLKNNLGASLLVMDVFNAYLERALQSALPGISYDLNAWKEKADQSTISEHSPFEVGYIGGGNALLFFWSAEQAHEFVQHWTRLLLLECPGLQTAVAHKKIDFQGAAVSDGFKNSLTELFEQLQDNKASYIPKTTLSGFGITATCPFTGFPADEWSQQAERAQYISQVAFAKRKAATDRDDMRFHKRLLGDGIQAVLGDWKLPEDLEAMGQKKGEDNHIAVVHIDGNSMGKRFQAVETLSELRALSHSVRKATQTAFYALIETAKAFTQKMSEIPQEPLNVLQFDVGNDRVLPIRPIILGGDDITFITHGKLGVYFAEKYMEAFAQQPASDKKPLSSCAGIAMIKAKYPFYKGIHLAEELCQAAKAKRRELSSEGSWLDFQVANTNISGSLEQIRLYQYTLSEKQQKLLLRPYPLQSKQHIDLQELKGHLSTMFIEHATKWPRNKVKTLRSMLYEPEAYHQRFIDSEKVQNNHLPIFRGGHFAGSLFADYQEQRVTPLFDLIELSEVYPLTELMKQELVHA